MLRFLTASLLLAVWLAPVAPAATIEVLQLEDLERIYPVHATQNYPIENYDQMFWSMQYEIAVPQWAQQPITADYEISVDSLTWFAGSSPTQTDLTTSFGPWDSIIAVIESEWTTLDVDTVGLRVGVLFYENRSPYVAPYFVDVDQVNLSGFRVTIQDPAVPEPFSGLLLAVGGIIVGAAVRRRPEIAAIALALIAANAQAAPIQLTDSSLDVRLSVRGQETTLSIPQTFAASGTLDPDAFTFTLETWSLAPPTESIVWQSSPYNAIVTYDPPGFEPTVVTPYTGAVTTARWDWGPGYTLEGVGVIPVTLELHPATLRAVYAAILSPQVLGWLSIDLPWLSEPARLEVRGTPILALECYAGLTCDAEFGLGIATSLEPAFPGEYFIEDAWPVLGALNPTYTTSTVIGHSAHLLQVDLHERVQGARYTVPEPAIFWLLLCMVIALIQRHGEPEE
jgi:hypothetical protein